MTPKYLYLTIDLLSFALPFFASFYPKASFFRKWKYVWPAIAASAVVFILWDSLFTHLGVWGFNPRYITGFTLLGLPVEEILFFICIPYACLFTYFALNHLIEKDHLFIHQELISSVLIIFLLMAGLYNLHHLYTATSFLSTGIFLAFAMLRLRMRFMSRFYLAFAVLLLPFFIVNGFLTGLFTTEPVVWYNSEDNIGLRLGTIPVEDVAYGLLMILLPTAIWHKLEEFY